MDIPRFLGSESSPATSAFSLSRGADVLARGGFSGGASRCVSSSAISLCYEGENEARLVLCVRTNESQQNAGGPDVWPFRTPMTAQLSYYIEL